MKFSIVIWIGMFACILVSCSKNGNENPYRDWDGDGRPQVVNNKPIDPNTIEGLHKNIFKPTCSNSGCHDGNFEPDFRTIESSYNSLINRITINKDPNNPQFAVRVYPGDPAKSMIMHRLNTFIPGTQGIMPLVIDPGSDWPAKKNEYLQNISTWISNGAKDQFGNNPSAIDFPPQMGGLIVFGDGSGSPLPRSAYNPVIVPAGTSSIKIMFAYTDDKTAIPQFGQGTVNFSLNPNVYDSTEINMVKEGSPFNAKGVSGSNIDYWHSVTVNVSDIGVSGDVIWIRTLVTDQVNAPLFIPSPSTNFNFIKYFAIKIQ